MAYSPLMVALDGLWLVVSNGEPIVAFPTVEKAREFVSTTRLPDAHVQHIPLGGRPNHITASDIERREREIKEQYKRLFPPMELEPIKWEAMIKASPWFGPKLSGGVPDSEIYGSSVI